MTAVALHAESGADAREVRWIAPGTPLPEPGTVVRAPAALAALLADGTLDEVRVLPGCIATRAAAGTDWRRAGADVRRAVAAALAEPSGWEVLPLGPATDDARLAEAARDLLAGQVGDYARSHGGSIELVDVSGGVVAVRLRGTCHGCPASTLTLRHQLEARLREREPGLVAVVERG